MSIRFNMQEYINDLMAEGYSKSFAILKAKEENKKRQKRILIEIKLRNDRLIEDHCSKNLLKGDLKCQR